VAPEAGANAHVPARHPLAYFFALFVPRGFLGGGGGGLGAVLMAMAVILIIAAIAIPSLLRARMAANEAAAVADLRLIAAAEESCLAAAGHYTTVECLARPADCPALAHVPGAAPLDVGLVSEGPRRGYTRRFLAGPPVTSADGALRSPLALTSYACVAEPVVPGNTGSRAFCIDGTGVIRYSVDGKAQEAGDGSCPRRWPVATTH
jgi:type II secretory pathway pseudopilin PulG